MDSKVGLKKYTSLDGKWRFVPVRWVNGSPRPDTIVIDGKPVKHKGGGTFYLDWREGGKRVQRPCGKGAREALDAWRTKTSTEPAPHDLGEEEGEPDGRATIDDAVASFLKGIRGTKSPATQAAYERDLRWFRKVCLKTFVAQVGRAELLDIFTAGRDTKANQKTINRRVMVSLMALRKAGSTVKLDKGDWPKTADHEVETFEADDLAVFFAACDPLERLLFKTFLASGLRAREVATLCWSDIDYRARTLTVREKPEMGFKPKNHEHRSVTVPLTLIEALRSLEQGSTSQLVFPSPPHPKRKNYGGDSPDAHHLEICKDAAYRAGLNCGRCVNSRRERCANGPTCERWHLHKFRATYATEHLRSGMDLRSLMLELGHKNLQTTERYLAKLHQSKVRDRVEGSSIAAMVA